MLISQKFLSLFDTQHDILKTKLLKIRSAQQPEIHNCQFEPSVHDILQALCFSQKIVHLLGDPAILFLHLVTPLNCSFTW